VPRTGQAALAMVIWMRQAEMDAIAAYSATPRSGNRSAHAGNGGDGLKPITVALLQFAMRGLAGILLIFVMLLGAQCQLTAAKKAWLQNARWVLFSVVIGGTSTQRS